MTAMTSMWLCFAFSMWCAWMSERRTAWKSTDSGEKVILNNEKFFYALLALSMCLFVGLRKWCNDTGTYLDGYAFISTRGSLFANMSWKLGSSPGFELVNRIIKRIGFSDQNFLMFYSFLTNCLYLWFVRKYSKSFPFSVFLLWTMGVYLFTAAAMRQALSIALGCVAVDRAIRKKWKGFVVFLLIASTFHPYVLLFGVLPFLRFKPWHRQTWILLLVTLVVGVALQSLLGVVFAVTDLMGKEYSADSFSGEGVNVFRLLVVWAPVVLSWFVKDKMREEDTVGNLLMNLSMVNAMIMFIALFGTANYFARLANYFLIFQTLSLPWIISLWERKNQRALLLIVPACYLLYFVFANVVLTPFNSYLAKMSLVEYLKQLLL